MILQSKPSMSRNAEGTRMLPWNSPTTSLTPFYGATATYSIHELLALACIYVHARAHTHTKIEINRVQPCCRSSPMTIQGYAAGRELLDEAPRGKVWFTAHCSNWFSPEHQCPNMFQLNTKRCNSKQTNKDRSRMGCCVLGDRDAVPRSGVYTLSGSHMKWKRRAFCWGHIIIN